MENKNKFINSTAGQILLTAGVSIAVYGIKKAIESYFDKQNLKLKELVRKERIEDVKRVYEHKCKTKLHYTELQAARDAEARQDEEASSIEAVKAETFSDVIERAEMNDKGNTDIIGEYLSKEDICVIFGKQGVGKSFLAMQAAIEIASGEKSRLLPESCGTPVEAQEVVYFDMELTGKQMLKRYESIKDCLINLPNLKRVSFVYSAEGIERYIDSMDKSRDATVFIDNKSLIPGMNHPDETASFIKKLKELQESFSKNGSSLTIILLAHSKGSNYQDDDPIAGSSNLIRFATSAFEVKKIEHDKDRVVIKTQKSRNFERPEGVFVMRKCGSPYLHYEYEGMMEENVALKLTSGSIVNSVSSSTADRKKTFTGDEENEVKTAIMELHGQGKSINCVLSELLQKHPKLRRAYVQRTINNNRKGIKKQK